MRTTLLFIVTAIASFAVCMSIGNLCRGADDPMEPFGDTRPADAPCAPADAKAGSIPPIPACPCKDGLCMAPTTATKSDQPPAPIPLPLAADIPQALADAIAALEKSRANVTALQTSKGTAQKALDDITTQLSSGTVQLATDTKAAADAWQAYLNGGVTPSPTPTPVPVPPSPSPTPSTHKVEIIVAAKSAGCPSCEQLQPTVEALAKEGMPISRVNIDVAGNTFNVSKVPTLILTVDGKERDRSVGVFGHDAIKTWHAAWVKYVKDLQ